MIGKGILIVEDENIVALDMRMRLESLGYRVLDVADTGEKAIQRAADLHPDLVLMDIKLKGGVDGIEAARQLREKARVPIIFVTAFTDEKTLERAKFASPYGYIVKPFHERELRIAIELALYKHHYELSMLRAKDLAEEANRLKGEFMANMSHELKTPLNSVIGLTELAIDKAVDPEQRELLAMALGSSKSLLTLIDSILDYTRMEAGRLGATPAPFSLDALLGECVDALSIEAYTKGLEVWFRRDPELPDSIVGDSGLLKHTLLNLVDNAVKFTDSGFVELSALRQPPPDALPESQPAAAASLPWESSEGGLRIRFVVSDSGIGMESDRVAAAFERFTQLDPSKTRRAGGTGLGLAIVKRNVELLGGSIAVESRLGAGTRFELSIPFALGSEADRAKQPVLAGREVLVAGFEGRVAEEAGRIVASLGGAPSFAGSVAGASPGSLVLADERAVSEIRDRGSLGDLAGRLVVATRFGGGSRSRLSRCDGIAFVPMPLRADRLSEAVAELAARPPASASDRRGLPPQAESPQAGSAARHAVAALSLEGARLLVGLAERIESGFAPADPERMGAISPGSNGFLKGDVAFVDVEREIKRLREELTASGDEEGARLAFSALLLARKGDGEGLKGLASRARELASKTFCK